MQQPFVLHENRHFAHPVLGGFVLRSSLHDTADLEKLFEPPAQCAPLALRPFAGKAMVFQNGAVRIATHSTARSFQLHRRAVYGHLVLGYANAATTIMQRGRPIEPHDIVVVTSGSADLNFLGPAEFVWIDVDLSRLPESQAHALLRAIPANDVLLTCDNLAIDALRAAFRLSPASLSNRYGIAGSAGSQTTLVALVRRALESSRPKCDSGKLEKAYALVERTENFMWDNVEDAITLERICAAVSCRARSLTYYFKSLVGVGPMTYLKIRRLENAHRRLREAGPAVRVFDVAADFGFWHMGHFSSDYKRMFGTTPSETRDYRHNGVAE